MAKYNLTMINKENYVYWLEGDKDTVNQEVVWRELYSRYGYIFHTVQMIEYNIANILAIEKYASRVNKPLSEERFERIKKAINKEFKKLLEQTFGDLKSRVRRSNYLKEVDYDELSKIVEYRNYLAHSCYKENLLKNKLNTIESVDAFVSELNDYECSVVELNNKLVKIFEKYKKRPF